MHIARKREHGLSCILQLVLFGLVVCLTAIVGSAVESEEGRDLAYKEMERLTEVMVHIKKYYVEEKSYEDIITGAISGMMGSLDPHSCFLRPEAYSGIQDDTSGHYSGIGIHIGMKGGVLTIIAPIEDTPGYRAGLQSGDRIIEIDGEKTAGITMRDAVKKLRGEEASEVVLTISRTDLEEPLTVKIVREDIEVPSVKGTRIVREGVGYVRITQFAEPTAASLQEALDELIDQGMTALVLDLRSNPGGLLKSAIEVSQKFLRRGTLVVTTRGREGVKDEVRSEARGKYHYEDMPIAVLINGGSASASEIVAGALQDHKRAILVGDTSFGKGSVQSIIKLKTDSESGLRLTTAKYYTPSGRLIHDKGIDPDIPVYISREEWRNVQVRRRHLETPDVFSDEEKEKYLEVVDRQLQRSVDLLVGILAFQSHDG